MSLGCSSPRSLKNPALSSECVSCPSPFRSRLSQNSSASWSATQASNLSSMLRTCSCFKKLLNSGLDIPSSRCSDDCMLFGEPMDSARTFLTAFGISSSRKFTSVTSSSFFSSFLASVLTSVICSATTPVSKDSIANPMVKMYKKKTNHIGGISSYTIFEMLVQSSSVSIWNSVTNDLVTDPQYNSISALLLKNRSPSFMANLAWFPATSVKMIAKMSMTMSMSNAIQNTVPMDTSRPLANLFSWSQALKIRITRSVRKIRNTRKIRKTSSPLPPARSSSKGSTHCDVTHMTTMVKSK
mmetsp:Transcript_98164/g.249068  ORF Transcript_98164/g.249068 Transcript_98164/m.249068 type:complete len:298 (-) Transcript_98164:467-1360(-)